ncbi:MAG: hypothetical protein IIY94_02480 [Oscillospiraceae bacterium]|nr:hypothetical protein [Oscillospiraceae bacterium]
MKKRVVSVTLALTLACSMLLTNANASYRRKLTGATEATKQEIEYLNAQCKESVEKAN